MKAIKWTQVLILDNENICDEEINGWSFDILHRSNVKKLPNSIVMKAGMQSDHRLNIKAVFTRYGDSHVKD